MPMIPRADAQELARQAVVLDLGDLARQGQAILQRAHERAQAIIEEAKAERQRLIEGAHQLGYQQGLEQGLAEGTKRGLEQGKAQAIEAQREALEALGQAWREALERFEAMRGQLRLDAERSLLGLAVRLGERVAKRALEADEQAARRQLVEALELVLAPSRVRIRVCPADAALVSQALPELSERLSGSAEVAVVEDDTLSPGSVVVEADQTRIDASIETQVARLAEAILPGGGP